MAVGGTPLSKAYWRTWSAVGVSSLGDGLAFAALPLLAESLSDRGIWVTLTFAASRLPWLLFGLPAGAWVDSRSARHTMQQMDGVRFLTMVVLGVAVYAGVASIPMVLVVAFVIGVADCAHIPAAASFLPSIVRSGELDRGNSYLSSAELAGEQFAGPAFGAVLFSWVPWLPFVGDACSFYASGVLIGGVKVEAEPRPVADRLSLRPDISAGWAWFRNNRDLWALTIFLCVGAAAAGMTNSSLVLYGKRHLGLTNWQYGLFLAIPAIGGLVGSAVAFRLWRRFGTRRSVVGSFVGLVLAFTVLASTRSPIVAAAAFTIDGFIPPVINTIIRTLRQQDVPADLLGRVASVGRLMFIGAAFAGAAVAGLVADLATIPTVYGVAAVLAGSALLLGGRRLWQIRLEFHPSAG